DGIDVHDVGGTDIDAVSATVTSGHVGVSGHSRSTPDDVVLSSRAGEVRGTVCLLYPSLECDGGLEKHVGQFGPGNGNEKQRREEDVERKQYPRRDLICVRGLHVTPNQRERDARQKRTDKQVGLPEVERRRAVIGHVHAQKEKKPQTADENQQGAYCPESRQDRRRV